MKQFLFFCLVMIAQTVCAQDAAETAKDSIYDAKAVDITPEIEGGKDKMLQYVAKNYKLPDEENLNGKIIVSFVVEKDGSVSNYKIEQDIGYNTGEKLVQMLQKFDRWKPGQKDGNPVRVRYKFPLNVSSAR